MHLRVGGDNGTQQRLRALDIDGEVIVDEKDGNLTVLPPGARFQSQKFINNALVCAKPNRVSEKAGHGAELAPVRTTAPRLDRNNAKRPPPPSYTPEQRARHLWNHIELVEVDRLPRDRRIWLERGLALLASLTAGSFSRKPETQHGKITAPDSFDWCHSGCSADRAHPDALSVPHQTATVGV